MHIDISLPMALPLPEAALASAVRALSAWALAGGAARIAGLAVWRGGPEDRGGGNSLVLEGARLPSDPSTDPLCAAAAGLPEAVTALEAEPAVLHAPDTGGIERLTLTLPLAIPAERAAGNFGSAFEGRRLLILRPPVFTPARMDRSLGHIGFQADFAAGAGEARVRIATAAREGEFYDFVAISRLLAGDRLGSIVAGLRAGPGGAAMRIILIGGEPSDLAAHDIDAVIPRQQNWRRLFLVLFDLLRRPRATRGGAWAQPGMEEVPALIGKHILIAEDVAMNRALLQAMLAPTGATFAVASDGAEAVASMTERAADLVLMDIQMPVMDGLEATRRIRAAFPHAHVIALTANAREADRATYLALGMDGYLAKPIRVDDLYGALRDALG
ncbi:MAG: response regulator [Pseudomonadota bacterium]